MKTRLLTALAAAAALGAAGCTASPDDDTVPDPVQWVPVSAQLASYQTCDEALEGIQDAAITALSGWSTGPYGTEELARGDEGAMAEEDSFAGAGTEAADGSYSETNNAVAGVDEPDVVKTDGTVVYSVTDYRLRAVDTRSAEVVAERGMPDASWDHQLFLSEHSLMVMYTNDVQTDESYYSEFTLERLDPETLDVLDRFTMEGSMVDARLVGGEVRLAVSSQPQMQPVWDLMWSGEADEDDIAAAVRDTEIEDWLPEYFVNDEAGQVDCENVAHPERFSGSSVSVFALPAEDAWPLVEPHTIMADGETVHGTADSLYLAHYDYSWDEEESKAESEIYRFAFEDGAPRLAGEAAVPGSLLNQYSLSEYDGHLRVATTETPGWGCPMEAMCAWGGDAAEVAEPSKSTVTVFSVGDDSLEETGSVSDLGVDEQIYAVRFIGDTGYVVTFRQTDPLYTLDLSDPANPVVTGELKITGYSGYLHPVGADRLLGVGQEATEEGQTTGLQVSLFDTGAAEATVLDQYQREGAQSSVEWEPHAFLYWEETGIAVVPATEWGDYGDEFATGAVVLEVGEDSLSEAAWITQSEANESDPYLGEILRAMVIDGRLWTLSNTGLQANELGGDYETTAWVSFQ
ncbi:beta-propeller domain-containing protein [Glycomyces harbinensis]|uniref:Secreted protein containing C-terminal beta-propeller domain n=1 Tax=Glycomyces harbinensis TaxID=58114 RepID=A0A1G6YJV2_9ACTN|nr:beta-propeller domain-containing protein [Glycomyces harbinensis]SDD89977.1 Secreted protein containing C-terminal beta-propeller domain [Glycomyces harbinensis]